MADSIQNIDKKCIFRDTFESEFNTRRLNGTPTAVTFNKGVATISTAISYINVQLPINSSLRFRIKKVSNGVAANVIFTNNTIGSSISKLIIQFQSNDVIRIYNGIYISETVSSYTSLTDTYDIVLTESEAEGNLYINGVLALASIGVRSGGDKEGFATLNSGCGNIELFEVYNYTLTLNDIKNLYENKRYRKINSRTGLTPLLDVCACNGVIRNKYSGNYINGNLVPSVAVTATEVVKDNDVWAMKFNGTSSKIDCGSYDGLVGDKTFLVWVNANTWGYTPNNFYGTFIHNNKIIFRFVTPDVKAIQFSSNGSNFAQANNVVSLFKWYQIVVTRTSAGVTNLYVNGLPVGTANQSSGTPEVGTSNIIIGGTAVSSHITKGELSCVRIYDGLLTSQEIAELYSSEKYKYGN